MSRQADILRPVTPLAATQPTSPRFFLRLQQLLAGIAATLFTALTAFAADTAVTSTRVWPAPDYTRVTIESAQPIRHKLFSLDNPERLVLDLEDVALSTTLTEIAGKISVADPYVKGVRAGIYAMTTRTDEKVAGV